MLEQAIAHYIDNIGLDFGDDDLVIKQLMLDATLIACRIQEQRALAQCRPLADNDN